MQNSNYSEGPQDPAFNLYNSATDQSRSANNIHHQSAPPTANNWFTGVNHHQVQHPSNHFHQQHAVMNQQHYHQQQDPPQSLGGASNFVGYQQINNPPPGRTTTSLHGQTAQLNNTYSIANKQYVQQHYLNLNSNCNLSSTIGCNSKISQTLTFSKIHRYHNKNQKQDDPWDWGWEDNSKNANRKPMPPKAPTENTTSIQDQIRDQADAIISSFGQANDASWNWSFNDAKKESQIGNNKPLANAPPKIGQNSPRNISSLQNVSRRSSGSSTGVQGENFNTPPTMMLTNQALDNLNQGVKNLSLQNHDRGNVEVVSSQNSVVQPGPPKTSNVLPPMSGPGNMSLEELVRCHIELLIETLQRRKVKILCLYKTLCSQVLTHTYTLPDTSQNIGLNQMKSVKSESLLNLEPANA
ncbi:uncharacterized protein LOC113364320 [Ctenocephalides felis]|uniref:uncharacterized protein LOC113364320 n=1 Tax=Ctenocephalides felis TaxID=7515 RepID=UPI000E6E1BCF|nr:uncharacterized protein LOC113364320 [Ctenocephalides felis]